MFRIPGFKVFFVLTILYAVFFAWLAFKSWWDFTHPQAWQRAVDDPHVYVWMVGFGFMVVVYVFVTIYRGEFKRHRQAQRKATVAMLLKRAETLIRENKTQEAEACLDECKRLTGYREIT